MYTFLIPLGIGEKLCSDVGTCILPNELQPCGVPELLTRGFSLISFDRMQSRDPSLDWIRDAAFNVCFLIDFLIMIDRGSTIREKMVYTCTHNSIVVKE